MAEFDPDQPRVDQDSEEPIQPDSPLFERNASSSSLISLVSSGSLDYYSCEEVPEDIPTGEQPMSELSLAFSSPFLYFVDRCIQIDEHAPDRLHSYAHVNHDDMERQSTWDPLALETSWHRQQGLDHAQMRHIAISEETAEPIQNEAALAAHETSEITPLEVVLKLKLFKHFPEIIKPFLPAPPYPPNLAALLLASFLSPPAPTLPPEEEQESMVELIELFP